MQKKTSKITVSAKVGKGRGKKLGIPTINFAVPTDLSMKHGIYAGYLYLKDESYPTAIHFGPRPTFDEKEITLEAHIIGEKIPKKVEKAQLKFVSYIREIEDFETPEKMVEMIKQDINEIKSRLVAPSFNL